MNKNTFNLGRLAFVRSSLLLVSLGFAAIASAQTTYTNTASGNWGTTTSWTPNATVPTGGAYNATIQFSPSGTDKSTNDLSGAFFLNQMSLTTAQAVTNTAAGGISLLFTNSGATLPLLTNASTGTLALNSAITLATNLTIGVAAGGKIIINSNLTESLVGTTLAGVTLVGAGQTLFTSSNTYSGNTTVNAGNLIVSNGGAIYSPASTLNVGAGGAATNTLGTGGSITVAQLLATNGVLGATTVNSLFNFSGGSLITSNAAIAIAANILLASNVAYYVNGNWTMNGGTNIITFAQTNGNFNAPVLGFGVGNLQVNVNSNAVFQIGNASYSITNSADMTVGSGSAGSNNVLTVNGGTMAIVNSLGLVIGYAGAGNNAVIITNGGQLVRSGSYSRGVQVGVTGTPNCTNNSLYVGGTNSAGVKAAFINFTSFTMAGNYGLVKVDQGGVFTNASGGFTLALNGGVGNGVIVTNGGILSIANGASYIGRNTGASTNYVIVAGADAAGNRATFANAGNILHIGSQGGAITAGSCTNNWALVGQNGSMVVGTLDIGGAASEMGEIGNYLIVTNGGLFTSTSATIGAGAGTNNGNWVYVGGNFGPTNAQWSLGGNALTLGGTGANTNNTLTVGSGGVVTNITTLTIGGGANTYSNGVIVSGGMVGLNSAVVNANNYITNNGGTFVAQANGNWFSGAGTFGIGPSGMTNNTSTYTVTNGMVISGSGGLTEIGTGTLVLTNANTYTGGTVISAGTLVANNNSALGTGLLTLASGTTLSNTVSSTLTNAINLSGNATFGVLLANTLTLASAITNTVNLTMAGLGTLNLTNANNTIGGTTVVTSGKLGINGTNLGPVSINASGALVPGGLGTIGTLTITTNLTLSGGNSLFFNINSTSSYDQIVVGGTNVVNNTNYLQVNGTLAAGAYYLITNKFPTLGSGVIVFAGTGTTNLTVGGLTLTLTNGANSVVLGVAGSGTVGVTNLTWKGYVNGAWDLATTTNWNNGAPTAYVENAFVTFDDTANNFSVTNNAGSSYSPAPSAVWFVNNTYNYTNAVSLQSGLVTLNGSKNVTLTGTNTYTGVTTVNGGGGLLVGNGGGSGQIWTNIVLNSGWLTYNLTNNYTQAGTIASTNSSVNITNLATLAGSTLELTMADGTKTFANIVNKSAGTLALNGSANSTNTVVNGLNSPANTTLRVDGGVWTNTPSLVMTASATLLVNGGTLNAIGGMRHYVGNLTISNGVMTVGGTSDRLGITDTSGQTFTMAGGTLNVNSTATYGFRMGGDSGATGTYNAFTGVQSGGTVNIYKGGNNTSFSVGGSISSSVMDSYTLLGGTLNVIGGGTDGCLLISADVAGTGTTTFTLGGGKLIVSGSTPGYNQANLAGAQNTGTPNQVFNWTNGILVAGACTMTNLQSVAGGAYGTLTNGGGTLAPGDIGTPGKTIIIGNYGQGSGGTLAIDIGGTNQGNAFQNGATNYDFVSVSGNATLGGSLNVSLINSFVPAATNSFIILTNGGTLSMAFANLTAGNRVALAANPNASFLVVTTATKVILTNYLVAASTTTALNSSANPSVYGQSVTFTATVQTNGVAVGNATSSYVFYVNGTPVATNAVASGSASYSTSGLTVAGSPHPIQVVYLGDPNYLTSTNSMTQTVNQGTPVVSTALSATAITYGQRLTNSTLSGAFTNIAGTAVSGTLTFAQPTLVPNAPSTNVAVIFTPVDTTDYLSVTNTVSVTVNPAASGLTLASSNPTNGYQTAVYFTATVPTNATGSIIFLATNGGFGAVISTNSLTNGQAISLTITSLPRGTNIITAQYAGDSNYIGSTNTLNQIVTNHPPVAAVMTVVGTKGVDLAIALADVATNWTDADGDPISLTGVNLTTTNGVALSASNWVYQTNGSLVSIVTTNSWSFIFYSGGPSVADQISYSINDGQGGTNIGYINIVLDTNSVVGTNSIASITVGTSNVITAYGIPGYTYILERATNLAGPVWVNVATNVAATNGVINAVDTFWDLGGVPPSPSAFYQLKWPSP